MQAPNIARCKMKGDRDRGDPINVRLGFTPKDKLKNLKRLVLHPHCKKLTLNKLLKIKNTARLYISF